MNEQPPIGYVSITETDTDGQIIYGVFNTAEEGLEFGSKLINCVVYPIYQPTLH